MTDYDELLRHNSMNETIEIIFNRIVAELPNRDMGVPQSLLCEALIAFFSCGATMAMEREALSLNELDGNNIKVTHH